jgi:hypothetical protein
VNAKIRRIWTPANEDQGQQGFGHSLFSRQAIPNISRATLPGVMREIDIWRVAVLMVNRYADEAKAE